MQARQNCTAKETLHEKRQFAYILGIRNGPLQNATKPNVEHRIKSPMWPYNPDEADWLAALR